MSNITTAKDTGPTKKLVTRKVDDVPEVPVPLHQHRFSPTYELLDGREAPTIVIAADVIKDIGALIALSDKDEIGWFGLADRKKTKAGLQVHVTKIFLLKQGVHGATNEIDKSAIIDLAMELRREGGSTLYNQLRFWGHVHPGNDTSPSGQDDVQVEKFRKAGCKWYLRGIFGKQGKADFTYYDFEEGIKFSDCPWTSDDVGSYSKFMKKWAKEVGQKVLSIEFEREYTRSGGHTIGPMEDVWDDYRGEFTNYGRTAVPSDAELQRLYPRTSDRVQGPQGPFGSRQGYIEELEQIRQLSERGVEVDDVTQELLDELEEQRKMDMTELNDDVPPTGSATMEYED